MSEQFPISSKGGSFPRKRGGGGTPLARLLILLQEKRTARLSASDDHAAELAEEFIALTDGKLAVVYDVSVDFHRNLTQKRPFIASKIDPPTGTQIIEKVAICIA